jgi:hypothetical protein
LLRNLDNIKSMKPLIKYHRSGNCCFHKNTFWLRTYARLKKNCARLEKLTFSNKIILLFGFPNYCQNEFNCFL